MARSCCIINCHSRSHDSHGRPIGKEISFYRIPLWRKNCSSHVSEVTKRRRMAWIAAIRRPNITFQNTPAHMLVCSKHFHKGKPAYKMMECDPDWAPTISLGHTEIRASTTARLERLRGRARSKHTPEPEVEMAIPAKIHAGPAAVNVAATENQQLREQIRLMEKQKIQTSFRLERFAGSDDDIRFYTGFASYRHLKLFWSLLEPSVPLMIQASRANAAKKKHEIVSLSLQPIDEFFLFLMYLVAGLKERDLANRFSLPLSSVNWIIFTWTNYLYSVMGSMCIWMEKEDVRANLPKVFQDFSDTNIIVDCTELTCQTPSSLLLESEMSHCTMKGLIGMAPHGAITFVSSLYEGSISDEELFRCSGLPELLTDDMAVMVDKGFLISDVVKCKVYCPPFLQNRRKMSVLQAQKIARLRAYVEMLIRRVKENKLFSSIIPLSISGCINKLFSVACLLVNYQNKPLVRAWVR